MKNNPISNPLFDSNSFKTIFEQSPISTQIFSLDGQTVAVNKAWQKMWGANEKVALMYNILQDKQLEEAGILDNIKKAFNGKTIKLPVIKYVPQKTIPGMTTVSFRYTSAIISPIRNNKKDITGVVLMHEDVTALKENEEKLRYQAKLLASVTDAVIAINMDYEIQSWNKGAEKLYGWKSREVMGRLIYEIVPVEEYETGDRSSVMAALVKKGSWTGEVRQRHKSGKMLHILGTSSLIRNNQGEATGIIAVNKSISLYKEAEKEKAKLLSEVQQQQKKLDDIINNVPGVIWEAYGKPAEEKQQTNYVSKHIKKILGYSMKEWLGTPNFWLKIVHPEDKKKASDQATLLFKNKKNGVNRFRWLTKNGKILWVESYSSTVLNEQNEPIGMRGVTMDITQRKLAEEALQESEERFRNIVQLAPDVLYSIDLTGTLTSLSPSFEKLAGWKTKEWVGKSFTGLVHPDDLPYALKKFKQNLQGHTLSPYELRIKTKHGDYKVGEFRSSSYKEHGEVRGVIGIARDITDRVMKERRKDDFISMASHELKTPVTSLKLYTQLLQRHVKEVATPPIVISLEKMESQINRLTNLISDLLDISKIQTGKLEFRNETFSLAEVVQDVVESMRETTTHTIETIGKSDSMLYGDRDRIAQVLINFLTNAIKYSPHTGRIIVRVVKKKDTIVVSVQDFGIGIAKEHQEKIFDRFYQVTTTTKSAAAGLGIGLYISHEIISRYNGQIWVESEDGKGSTFYFSLPITAPKH